jgi:3'-5' exoribonuclease
MEYGSPKTPSFLEAFIVAAVDDFDSKVSTIAQIMRVEGAGGDKWSRYSQLFERYFLLRV